MGRPKIDQATFLETIGTEKGLQVLETRVSRPEYQKPQSFLWNAIKSLILARQPTGDAPLEYGGHREAEEPTRSTSGVLGKFLRFLGPGMIVTVAFIDPDNFQSNVQDGQDFKYKMLFTIFFSLLIAMYLQVSEFYI
jgi:metal iron transporter